MAENRVRINAKANTAGVYAIEATIERIAEDVLIAEASDEIVKAIQETEAKLTTAGYKVAKAE